MTTANLKKKELSKKEDKKATASQQEEVKNASIMQDLLNENEAEINVPELGDILKGTVISSTKHEVHIDIPSIGTGVIRGKELFDDFGTYEQLKPGDKVAASVIEVDNEDGEVELSFRKAGREKAWDTLKKLMQNSDIVTIRIAEVNKGGLMAQFNGVTGFLPVSQLDIEHYPRVDKGDKNLILERLQDYITKEFQVKIIDANQDEDKLIFSEKEARRQDREKSIEKHKVGDKVKGLISGTVDFGAFIRFDNLEGLIHISELAWQRIDDPADIVQVGKEVEAEIISIENGRISLSLKRLLKDPWADAVSKYKVGDVVEGEVTKVTTFGAFVQLDGDIHGLVHISELSSNLVRDPHEILSMGDRKKFQILSIEPKEHRLGLSLKAVTEKKKVETPAPATQSTEEKTEATAKEEKDSNAKTTDEKTASTKKSSKKASKPAKAKSKKAAE
jgi:small subunit ribosomal protein S1